MIMITFEQAKDQVAVKHGYPSFENIIFDFKDEKIGLTFLGAATKEAAELYAKSKWEEACEAQIDNCANIRFKFISPSMIRSVPKPEFKP